ncbi:putative bifunctional diguanylate cyclase/phosphodiesterase [Salinicola rhizosphaerae]|uniref:EAL domain-containing protein n=1 Tax=Salinicola rhizosphaerae TaxID=1443141 RepID=A0ABQ3DMV5_9GAMM|nr:EAL domain-containing protein [Salinicola rhizosphaerae]GHB07167.1 hypothetical protein GCM10009038_00440 [Salinicola rhizosphaerae]
MHSNDNAANDAPPGAAGPRERVPLEDALRATGQAAWHWHFPDEAIHFHGSRLPGGDAGDLQRLVLRGLLRVADPHSRAQLQHLRRQIRSGKNDGDLTLTLHGRSPAERVRLRGAVTARDHAGQPTAAAGTWETLSQTCPTPQAPTPHTAPQAMARSARVRAHAFASSRDPMLVVDANWRILEVNDAFVEMSESATQEILGRKLDHYLESATLDHTPGMVAAGPRALHHEGAFISASGVRIPIELTLSDFTLDDAGDIHYIAALRDISARKRSERELEHLASIDTLTQLPNRATLQSSLKHRLKQVTAERALAVLFIDLDGFKHINDSLGHQAGDALLRVMVKRLRATLRSKDLIARWGGDEFVVIVDVGADDTLADRISRRLLEALAQPMVLAGHQLSVTASIGVVHAPCDGQDSETLLKHADVAMYAAKDRGKNAIVAYHDQLKHHDLEQMSMLTQLRETITRQALDFVVQPKFDGSHRIIGAELLARWHTPTYGQVPPDVFVPLAEHNGMATALGNLAIEAAAKHAATLAASGHPLPVAVNVSALHVMDDGLSDALREACQRHGITTDQIELEVTESVFLENTRAPEVRIQRLRQEGFRVAMDDFGAGYSSLGYLKRLPFDTIKIDRSFMHDLEADPRSRHLLTGIVGLCNLLGMETVAEGVETEAQWQLLSELGVQQYQGYLLGRPMQMSQLIERLKA